MMSNIIKFENIITIANFGVSGQTLIMEAHVNGWSLTWVKWMPRIGCVSK